MKRKCKRRLVYRRRRQCRGSLGGDLIGAAVGLTLVGAALKNIQQ